MKIWMLALWVVSQAHGFVLDHEHKKPRSICGGEPQETTPLNESVMRGQCEPFAQGAGRIVVYHSDNAISQGTGMLISPDVVLTAAHVVDECMDKENKCEFEVSLSTKYAGETEITLPISEIRIPKEYRNLLLKVQELETTNTNLIEQKKKGDDESRAAILSQNMHDIAVYQKNMGEYDIAVVKLQGKVSGLTYLNIYPQNIKEKFSKGHNKLFGVAVNRVKDNRTGSYAVGYLNNVRHLSLFTIDETFIDTNNPLVASFTLPSDYQEKCQSVSGKKGIYPDRFVYNSLLPTLPFLMGIAQPGDSGGPLIAKVGGEFYIVGVAQQINYTQCFDSSSQKLAPNGTFFNIWTPTFNHFGWIKENIMKLRIEN